MSNYLADTTVLVEHLRNNQPARHFLEINTPYISSVNHAELIQGARDKRELQGVLDVCSALSEIAIDKKICLAAIALLKKFHLSHGLQFLDALIAATALENQLILVTNNTKHFRIIKGLKLLSHEEAFDKLRQK